ncbi:MAG: hypothetical protein U0R51_00785 [Solirubrobacterales bacterium]
MAAACAAIAIAAPAAASAKTVTYGGKIFPEGRMAMDVKVSDKGVAKKVVAIRAEKVPAHCDVSGDLHITININRENTDNPDGSPFGLKVNRKGKFNLDYTDPTYHQRKAIHGEFNGRRDVKLAGGFSYANHYPADGTYPEENCHTDDDIYTAKRGGKDVVFPERLNRR